MCGPSSNQKQIGEQQISFMKDLRKTFQDVFGDDSKVFKELHDSLAPIVQRGINAGVPAAVESAWRTSASERWSARGTQLAQTVSQNMAARGGGNISGASSGALASVLAEIGQKTMEGELGEQREITEKGYEYGRQNYEFAMKGLMESPNVFGNLPGIAGQVTNASEAAEHTQKDITEAKMAPWSAVAGIVGQAAGGLTGGIGANLGKSVGRSNPCWCAAEVFNGWDDPRVALARWWIFDVWAKNSVVGNIVSRVYRKIGKQTAWLAHRFNTLKRVLKVLFDRALSEARKAI